MSDAPDPNNVLITKDDLGKLQSVWKLFNSLWDDPKHGATLKRAAKEKDPTLRIPEIDVAEPLLAPIREEMETFKKTAGELRAENEALRQSLEDDKAMGKLLKDLGSAQSRYRLTDEGMAEVKKIMQERNIADPHAAAALVASEIEPAKVIRDTNFAPADLNVLGMDGKAEDDSTRRLHDNPIKWQDQEISNIMQEFEGSEAA